MVGTWVDVDEHAGNVHDLAQVIDYFFSQHRPSWESWDNMMTDVLYRLSPESVLPLFPSSAL